MSVTIPTGGNGDLNWTDLSDNWRDADATWLQERSIVRVTTTPPTVGSATGNVANVTAGRVFYDITAGKLTLSLGSSYKNILASANLNPALDSSTDVVLKVDGASYGITLKSGTTPIVLDRINTLKVDTTGSNLAQLTTSTSVDTATTVEIDKPIKVTAGTSPTTILRGTAVNTTTVTASGVVTGSRLVSTVGVGTAPFTVTSTTKVTNLNADRVDDLDSADLLNLGNATGTLDLTKTSGTLATARGGTGTGTSPIVGGIAYGATTSAYGVTAVGLTGQTITSNGASAPTWKYPDFYACTSTTRPTVGLSDGQAIYETDTGKILVWYTDYGWIMPTASPRGLLARGTLSVSRNITSTSFADITGFVTGSFAPVSGRNYKISVTAPVTQYLGSGSVGVYFIVTDNASTPNIIAEFPPVQLAATDYGIISGSYIFANTFTSSTIYKIRAKVTSGTVTVQGNLYGAQIIVEDIGQTIV